MGGTELPDYRQIQCFEEKLNWKNITSYLTRVGVCSIIANMKDIEEQLRQAIRKSEKSRYRICKEAGLSESQLSYFMNKDKEKRRSLTLPAAAKLAKVLGLELRPVKKARKK